MLNNYIKLALRALRRNKAFSLLNILGLAIGIGAALLIFLVIRNEMSYDDYQSKRDRIYRITSINYSRSNGEVAHMHSMVPAPLPGTMRRQFPSLEKVTALEEIGGAQIYVPGKQLSEEKRFKEDNGLFFTEPNLYDIFDFTWLDGNAKGLQEPNTVVLAQSLADNYFGSYTKAVGQTIQLWSYRVPLRVTGVFKDLPDNTDIPIRLGASFATFQNLDNGARRKKENGDDWISISGGSQCYVLTREHQDIRPLQAQLPAFVKRNFKEDDARTINTTSLQFQPLKTMHLDKRFGTSKGDSLSAKELGALALIGVFLLLVACINFINLATAQSVGRAKEIGVRKVLGSNRSQLRQQFLGETALITLLALIAGCVMAWIALPWLSQLMQKQLRMQLLHYPSVIAFLLLTGITVTLLAGFYPAVVVSRFNPVTAIKSRINSSKTSGISLRRGLVVFQFVIAQLLVIGTLVVVKQLNFFRSKSMGFQKEAIVLIDLPSDSSLKVRYPLLKTQLEQVPGVASASLCSSEPSSRFGQYTDFYYNNQADNQPFTVRAILADTGYFNTFRIGLAAGRFPYASDTVREIMVNETLIRKLGLKSSADILGRNLAFGGRPEIRYPVVGVLRDFNNMPLQESIYPMILSTNYNGYGTIALRLQPDRVQKTLEQVQKTFTEVYPTYIYDCTFLDERIGRFYKAEALTAQLFKAAAILAIFISCLGLYGLVSFMAVQRTKEVGIRKVLGASIEHIVYLFSKEFTVLIGVAFVIAAPLGYYFMEQWLAGFHYHTQIGWGIFVLAIVLSVLIAWITVGYKAIKAALANPVKSLRAE
jgi:predicted permease